MKNRRDRDRDSERSAERSLRRNSLLVAATAAFTASAVIFLILLGVEKNMLSAYEKGTVYIASREIPKSRMMSEEDCGVFLEERELDVKLIPASALRDPSQIGGLLARTDIDAGTILTKGMFEERQAVLAGLKHPVSAGIRAEDLYQVVGGTLRTGDRIHIYAVDEESGRAGLLWKNVYVEQAFDSAGGVVEGGDRQTAAQRINVLLEEEDVEQFYSGVEAGSLRAVRVLD